MSNKSDTISVVLVGVKRQTAIDSVKIFEGTPYSTVAVLDFVDSPEPLRFSPHHLGVVLNALHPWPRALVTGTAVDADVCASIEPVWKAYGQKLQEVSCWVALSKTHPTTGPPPPGIGDEILGQLADVFGGGS